MNLKLRVSISRNCLKVYSLDNAIAQSDFLIFIIHEFLSNMKMMPGCNIIQDQNS